MLCSYSARRRSLSVTFESRSRLIICSVINWAVNAAPIPSCHYHDNNIQQTSVP